ncbi:MAG: Signal recognition particle core component [Geoglossum umbratile]|nr:MAG: Signal recognition particle core component [Geoglossum umbratile]
MATLPSGLKSITTLLSQTSLDDHAEVLRAADAVLKESRTDAEALHVKVVALLWLDRYEDALGVLEEGGDRLKAKAALEWAYALYKVGRYTDAEGVVRKAGGKSRGLSHMGAQTCYRLEDFPKAAEIYKQLSKDPSGAVENEDNDLRINSKAIDAQLEWSGQGQFVQKERPSREDLEVFEVAYNAACGSIARGELGQGGVLLRRAKGVCNALEELSDEEKIAELLPIAVQQIYVLIKLGKIQEAERLSSEISIENIPEASTRRIAQNNSLIATEQPTNPYLAHRIFHSSPLMPKTGKPFEFQSSLLRRNNYTMELVSLKYAGVVKSTARYLSEHTSPTISADVNSISVLNAAAHARVQIGKAGLKKILPLLEERPNDVGLILLVLQLYVLTNNYGSAISLLESFFKRVEASSSLADQDVRFAPGLVSILISLYSLQGRKSYIRTELAKAASYWHRKSKPSPTLFKAAGKALLESPGTEDQIAAAEIFENLKAQDPTDRLSIAGYIASHVTPSSDLSKFQTDIDKLGPIPRIDAAALEEAGVPHAPTTSKSASKKRTADATVALPPTRKRIRKSRLPKDYDPSKLPDPERWLPLRDRSSYRPKGKKGKARAAAATQGGIVNPEKDSEKIELVGGTGVVKVEKMGGGGAGKTKKKKGKGAKW